ncbi:peptidylprolyl isomerase [Catellatospora methionotrophica]|uniref:peptidylprolyl isomerase n=1 Tax=Catellatospora methionotrophica TaxID=121620 RepID=UPI0033E6C2EB
MATPPWTPDASSHQAPTAQRRGTSGWLIAGVVTAIVVVLICAVVAAVVLVLRLRDGADPGTGLTPDTGGRPAATSAPAAGGCQWLPTDEASNPNIKNVGTPPRTVPTTGVQQLTMTTAQGVITVQVDTAKAPCAAASITYLASRKFFDNTRCHRLTTEGISVLQCGDPSSTGTGGPAYRFAEENLPTGATPYPVGTLAMAKTQEPASTGSQFFIVYGPTPIDPLYTVLGKVTAGMDVVQAIGKAGAVDEAGKPATDGAPKSPVTITTLTVTPAA